MPPNPEMHTELLGINALGRVIGVNPGAARAVATSKVRIPLLDTLKLVTGTPLKEKAKGMLCEVDHVGVVEGAKQVVQEVAKPPPEGYSSSAFNPPGLKPAFGLGICQYCACVCKPKNKAKHVIRSVFSFFMIFYYKCND
jgi:hypothetical protein